MANIFILNVDGQQAPVAGEKNANRLIALAIEHLGGEGVAPTPEPVNMAEGTTAIFNRVAAQEITPEQGKAELAKLEAAAAEAKKAAKAEPKVLMLEGQPASASEVKRAFRGSPNGHSVSISSLDGKTSGTITMYRV
jgi:hypothetical protein